MASASDPKKVDPFKTRKSKSEPRQVEDSVTPPADIAKAIDDFRACQEQAKHFEGEATVYKDQVTAYARQEYAKRSYLNSQTKSFKILGDETMITYVVMDASAGLADEDLEEFKDKWGEEAAEALIERDYRSIRFEPEVLKAHYNDIVAALQVLPPSILENLFKPMLLKSKPGAVATAKRFAKNAEELEDLLRDLKLKQHIK